MFGMLLKDLARPDILQRVGIRKEPFAVRASRKNWDRYVMHAEDLARSGGFETLKDSIIEKVAVSEKEVIADIGCGTGLLTLAMAENAERIWAIDISERMCDYLRAKASSAGRNNVETVVASATSLPLVDCSVHAVVSNYCFHHLSADDKARALHEVYRVLRPGGRFVFGDMMFEISLSVARDRAIIGSKVRGMLSNGVPGMIRLTKNVARFAAGSWENPARAQWWEATLRETGFVGIEVSEMSHEGGIALACRPLENDQVSARGMAEETPAVKVAAG